MSDHIEEVLRAKRLEVIDPLTGTLAAVVGRLDAPGVDPVFGLSLFDRSGRQRVWLTLDANGPAMVFDLAGNNVITLGVNDETADALHVGAYLHVADMDGTPVHGWQVEQDGTVLGRLGGPTR